jgi:YHS domain-containing protein
MRAAWWCWAVSVALSCTEKPRVLGGFSTPPADGIEIVCPVTGARCLKGPETESAVFESRTFYFCEPESQSVFVENPERYAYVAGA